MLKSSKFNYSDVHILVKETITALGAAADNVTRATGRNNAHRIFKKCAPLTNYKQNK